MNFQVIAGEVPPGRLRDMSNRERRIDRARRMARSSLAMVGNEFREARLQADLTQEEVSKQAGISSSQLSRIELGQARQVPYETLVAIAVVLGLDLPLRPFPSGDPVRDAPQIGLRGKLRAHVATSLGWRTEVPVAGRGDLRAWDAVIEGPGWRVPVEAETRIRDVQACTRRLALKQRDDGATVVILLVADTRHNRRALRLIEGDLAADFPISGRDALAALAAGEKPTGSAIVLL